MGTWPFLLGWASLCGSPQHNAGNPADLPSRGAGQELLASCLTEWLQWVLGPLLIPQQLTLLAVGRRKREKRRSALSPLSARGW